jgi:putative ABC transport system permease protein
MIKNYFKTAWRNLWRNKIYSSINIIGLAIGMAACIIILLFVSYERSFDNFNKKNIYRLNEVQKFEGMVAAQKVALSMFPMAPTLKAEFPQIKNYTRINAANNTPLNYGDKKVFIKRICFVDSTFLNLFDFKLLNGDRKSVLEKKNSIVLTKETAEKLFGKADPVGKVLANYSRDTTTLLVTGVLDNVPQNSQLQFDALIPFSTIEKPDWMNNWGGNWLNTYLELAANTNVTELEKKFPAYLKRHMSNDNWKSYELFLLPLKKVHGGANDIGLDNFNYQQFDESYTNLFFYYRSDCFIDSVHQFYEPLYGTFRRKSQGSWGEKIYRGIPLAIISAVYYRICCSITYCCRDCRLTGNYFFTRGKSFKPA